MHASLGLLRIVTRARIQNDGVGYGMCVLHTHATSRVQVLLFSLDEHILVGDEGELVKWNAERLS